MITVIMPQVGQDIPSGKIAQWLKSAGEAVEAGEVILIVESEKASFEVEAERAGVLLKILAEEGDDVEILKPVAYIGSPGEPLPDETGQADAPAPVASSPAVDPGEPAPRGGPAGRGASRAAASASPAARRIAGELGVDVAEVVGTGPGGRITARDVEAHALSSLPGDRGVETGAAQRVIPFSRMRRSIAARLAASKHDIPHFYLMIDVDATDALEWREAFNAAHDCHVTVTDLVVKAAALALRKYPLLNAHVRDDALVVSEDINVGIAVAVADGLLVPVVPRADAMPLAELAALAARNADEARGGRLRPAPPGTFTVSSLGMHGVRQFVPIINPPECAILAVGAAEDRVVPRDGRPAVRRVMTLTLACDHRAVDGAAAAGLLGEIKAILQSPAQALKEPT
jgi:pyruvate dehydrogenase E2 component (dihydrolipoamide acetyltransferase)